MSLICNGVATERATLTTAACDFGAFAGFRDLGNPRQLYLTRLHDAPFFVVFRDTLCDQSFLIGEEKQNNNKNAPDCGDEEFEAEKFKKVNPRIKTQRWHQRWSQCGWCLAITVTVTAIIVIFTSRWAKTSYPC